MLEQYQLAPKEEDEMEDFRDFDDEHSDLGSKLDEFADEEEDEEELDVLVVQTVVKAPEDPLSLAVPPAPAPPPPAKKPVEKATAPAAPKALAKAAAKAPAKAAVKKAAYKYLDRFSADISIVGARINCRLTSTSSNDQGSLQRLVEDFRKEVLDQDLREALKVETEAVRNLILSYAFSQTTIPSDENIS